MMTAADAGEILSHGQRSPPLTLLDSTGATFDLSQRASLQRQLFVWYRGHW